MNLEILSILYLLGVLQAIILGIGLNLNKPFSTPLKKIATLLLFSIAVAISYYLVLINRIELIYPYIDSLGSAAWMSFCPILYLLCLALAKPRFKLRTHHLFWFPISLLFILEGIINTLGGRVSLFGLIDSPQLFLDLWMGYFFISGGYFMFWSLRLLNSESNRISMKELKYFVYLISFVLVVFGGLYLVVRMHYSYMFEYVLVGLFEIFILVLIYRLFKFAKLPEVLGASVYGNSTTTNDEFKQEALRLEQTMLDSRPFLDKKLTLNKLSELAEISPNRLSQLFTIHYQSSFYEFINASRLRHAVQLLNNPEEDKYTISAKAEMSGFNSKATFYKVFKAKYSMSPSEYLKSRDKI